MRGYNKPKQPGGEKGGFSERMMLEQRSKNQQVHRYRGKESRVKKRSIQAVKRAYFIDMDFLKCGSVRAKRNKSCHFIGLVL